MKSKKLADKTFAVIFDSGDEAMEVLLSFAKEQKLGASNFTGIGACSTVVLGYFDWEKKDYNQIRVNEQVELVSLIGDITLEKGDPKVHAHAVVGKRDGSAMGGHLLKAYVRPTLEVVLTESPTHLQRSFDLQSGLALIRF